MVRVRYRNTDGTFTRSAGYAARSRFANPAAAAPGSSASVIIDFRTRRVRILTPYARLTKL